MTLENTIIVTTEQFSELYNRPNLGERKAEILENKGILPLSVENFTTPIGNALLHFATWTYLSGDLHHESFTPRIFHSSTNFLEHIVKTHLNNLDINFTPSKKGITAKEGGMWGRLLYCMGVPKPNGENQSKLNYRNGLPKYMTDILKSRPKTDFRRTELLRDITRIFFKDKLIINTKAPTLQYALDFSAHKTKEKAKQYGIQTIHLFNEALKTNRQQELLTSDQLVIWKRSDNNAYSCRLLFTNEQIGYFATRKPMLFNVEVKY